MLTENQLVKVEADQADAKSLKQILYAHVNKQPDFRLRPGQYNLRFLPDKTQMLSGATGTQLRIKTLCKHSAVIHSLTIIKSCSIKALDTPAKSNCITYTL